MDTSPQAQSGERRFGLDVLRAAAIGGVLASHFYAFRISQWFALGFFGVELFFILSGFLIGGLLLDIAERGATLREWFVFMVRRWMRTVPLYLLFTVALALIFPPGEGWPVVLRTLTFTQNLAWTMPDWFSVSWSLTIEEWFYLLFSALFLGLAAVTRKWAAALALAVFLTVPFVLRMHASDAGGDWDMTLRKVVIVRLDAIAYGVVMAVLWRYHAALLLRWRYVLFLLGAVAVGVMLSAIIPNGDLRWAIFPIASAGFALTIPVMMALPRPHAAIAWLIEWISTRSYALYIIHLTAFLQGVHALQEAGIPQDWARATSLIVVLVLADLSWRFFEMPILRARPKQFDRRREEGARRSAAAISGE
jgi:peptidoglycan/LPS O-acetylase OafA/YrhL